MRSTSGLSLFFVLLALGGGSWYLLSRPAKGQEPQAKAPPAEEPARPTEIRAKAAAPTPVVSVDSTEGMLRLADKTFVPNLNGVKTHAEMKGGILSPIDHKIVDQAGIEWYVLKNGDYLTTVNSPGTLGGKSVTRDIIVRHQTMAPIKDAVARKLTN